MSKQFVDKLIKQFLTNPKSKSRWDTVLRRQMGGNPHTTTITKKDLLTLYRDNTIAALYADKTFKEAQIAADRVKGIEIAATEAAEDVFANFEKYYAKSRGKRKGEVERVGGNILIRQPQGLHSAVQRIIWQEGWDHIKKSKVLSLGSRKKLKADEGKKLFKQRTQMLHEEMTTVGGYTLAKLYEGVMSNVVNSDFTKEQTATIAKTLNEFFGPITTQWKKDTKMDPYKLSDTLDIPLTIGPQSQNPSGSEAFDWKQLRPKLEAAIMKDVLAGQFGEEYAHSEGSRPLTERVKERALHIVVEKIEKSVKGKKSVKINVSKLPKEARKKVRYTGKASDNGKIKKAVSKGIAAKSYQAPAQEHKVPPPKMALKNILGILNTQLPRVIADNMGSPRLENRTGRFAQSVRAIEVQETDKGFTSIGYMYQKNPYQVFESTSGTRFSDTARDPRTLIDTSIREIAAQFGLGRIYTRRI